MMRSPYDPDSQRTCDALNGSFVIRFVEIGADELGDQEDVRWTERHVAALGSREYRVEVLDAISGPADGLREDRARKHG